MTSKSSDLIFPEFDDIKVSTKTFIVMTNLVVDLKKLFDFLPITDYIVVPKKRGRKKKSNNFEYNKDIMQGSIITLKFENLIRGVDLKQKKSLSHKKKSKWFRNSFTVVMIVDSKPINFKICQNGMFQITGCKFDHQAEECVKHIWNYIKLQNNVIFHFSKNTILETIFIPVMRNIDFSVGFLIDREKLAKYMNTQTEFHSLLETSFGYTGVNIKIPIDYDITLMKIKKMCFEVDDTITETFITYGEYLKCLSEKERMKKLNKDRYSTFLIFQSGKCIFSGLTYEFMKDTYYYFINIIRTCYEEIEERLD